MNGHVPHVTPLERRVLLSQYGPVLDGGPDDNSAYIDDLLDELLNVENVLP